MDYKKENYLQKCIRNRWKPNLKKYQIDLSEYTSFDYPHGHYVPDWIEDCENLETLRIGVARAPAYLPKFKKLKRLQVQYGLAIDTIYNFPNLIEFESKGFYKNETLDLNHLPNIEVLDFFYYARFKEIINTRHAPKLRFLEVRTEKVDNETTFKVQSSNHNGYVYYDRTVILNHENKIISDVLYSYYQAVPITYEEYFKIINRRYWGNLSIKELSDKVAELGNTT